MSPSDAAKYLARLMKVDIRRFLPATSAAAQLRAALAFYRVNLVFDIGANAGQFGRELRWHAGYQNRIVSFEPMKAAHALLTKAARGDSQWEVARSVALGAKTGATLINVAANSVSSSLLPMLPAHSDAAPESIYSGIEEIELTTLDLAAAAYVKPDSIIFLKIDTQGYESEVLAGGSQTLARSIGVQLEVSLVPLYSGQKLMKEMIAMMQANGFELWSLFPTFASETGRVLQLDATFFRPKIAVKSS